MSTPNFQPIGNLLRWERCDGVLDLFCQGGRVRVQILTPDLIRVRATADAEFGPDES